MRIFRPITPASTNPAKSRPRTVVHVPRRFVEHEWGGTESVLANLLREQRTAGWRPQIFTSLALSDQRRDEFEGAPVRRFEYCYPFIGLSTKQRLAMDKKGGNLLSWSLLSALAREPDVRLLHAHSLKRLGGIVRTAARWRGVPYVVTLHGGVFDVPAAETASLVAPQAGKFEWGRVPGALLGSRRVLEDADAVICIGRRETELARQRLCHERIYHLPNGVDAARFACGDGAAFRSKHGIAPDAKVILCVSRYDPQKDQRLLVEAFERVVRLEPRAALLLAGPSTVPDYVEALDARIAASPVASRIRRLGALAPGGAELAGAFHAADVFALASRHEPFGIVVLEAWSAGLPVVAAASGGLVDLVRSEQNGLLFEAGNVEACADALRRSLAEGDAVHRWGEAGRRLATERYSWRSVANQLEEIYTAAEERWARR